jgi:hypothetical protein
LSRLGNPARIVEAARAGRFVLVMSPKLRAELDDVLSWPKVAARLDPEALEHLREMIGAACTLLWLRGRDSNSRPSA